MTRRASTLSLGSCDDASTAFVSTDRLGALRDRVVRLEVQRHLLEAQRERRQRELTELDTQLALMPAVEARLKELTDELFGRTLEVVQQQLTLAVREVLGQVRRVVAVSHQHANRVEVSFHIEREDGEREDVLTGQGGSVCNVLSVGLRLIALAQLDPRRHRPFLILDEQDCWLREELVPRLMRIVRQTAQKLGYQVLIISHHDVGHFIDCADRIYRVEMDEEDKTASVTCVHDATGGELRRA